MNSEERLAAIVVALESVGLSCLIMGGQDRDRADKEAIRAAQQDGPK